MSKNKLQVEAIYRGTVIDHIPAGNGIKIVNRVQKLYPAARLTAGLNLPSGACGCKDLVKVDDWLFSEEEAYDMALFAPDATVNIIDNYQIVRKFSMSLPTAITGLFDCPNGNCISHLEPVQSRFRVVALDDRINLVCHYCERPFHSQLFA